jgi:gamma-glutamylputrescine oxidase
MVGQLILAHGTAGAARLARQAQALEATGQPCRQLGPTELAERIQLRWPQQVNPSALAAIRLPEAAVLNPVKLLHGLARAIHMRGGRIYQQTRVVELLPGSPALLRLASGQTVKAATVIFATASESTKVTRHHGRIIPISLKVAATHPLDDQQLAKLGWKGRECIIDSRRLFNYFRLTMDNRIVFGGGAPSYGTRPATHSSFDDLHRELAQTFPQLAMPAIAQQWYGTIDYTLDGLPVIGPTQAEGNVIYVGGFCGHGIALSLYSGKLVADLVGRKAAASRLVSLRRKAPLVPGEWLRRLSFSAATGWMQFRGI